MTVMLKNINLNSPEWCELVFTGKNREYGAYELRKTSSSRHIRALLIVVAGAILIMVLPAIIKSVVPQHAKEQVLEVTALSDLKMETKVPEENVVRNIEAPPPPKLKSTIKFTPPVIKADKEVNDNEEIKTQEELTTSKMAISVADVQGTDSEDAIDIADLKDNKEVIQEETKPYTAVEQMPEYPGGTTELLKYIAEHLKYPVLAAEQGIQGKRDDPFCGQSERRSDGCGNTPQARSFMRQRGNTCNQITPEMDAGQAERQGCSRLLHGSGTV